MWKVLYAIWCSGIFNNVIVCLDGFFSLYSLVSKDVVEHNGFKFRPGAFCNFLMPALRKLFAVWNVGLKFMFPGHSFLDFWCVHAKSLRTIWIGKTFASTHGCAGFAVAWARAPGTIKR